VDSAFLDNCGRWKRYCRGDAYRGNPEIDILEASLDDTSALEDLHDEYNDHVDIYYDDETGESFVELVTSHVVMPANPAAERFEVTRFIFSYIEVNQNYNLGQIH
jgi:zona occludens toxin (predicted ATPase)